MRKFNILVTDREELGEILGKDIINRLDDTEIAYILSKVTDALIELGYWDTLKLVFEEYAHNEKE